jgi:hypothetical protein
MIPKEKIENIIANHKNEENKTIELEKINKVIDYKNEEVLEKLISYLKTFEGTS